MCPITLRSLSLLLMTEPTTQVAFNTTSFPTRHVGIVWCAINELAVILLTNVRLQSCENGVTDGQTHDGGANQDPPNGLTDKDMTSENPTGSKSHHNIADINRSLKREQESEHT
jgi:hypothetical protein